VPASERVLVTGAAGFAGGHLLDRLGGTSDIVGWYRPGTEPGPAGRHVLWRAVELTDAVAVREAVEAARPGRIYHLAGAPSVETSWVNAVPHLEINALGTHFLLDTVRRLRLDCRVLVVTSAQVYQVSERALDEQAPRVPSSPYGLTKLAQDQIALQAASADGMDVVVARPFNHAGPRQTPGFAIASFARQVAGIEAGREPPVMHVGNLDTRRDISDVRDVVDAYVRIMEGGETGEVYNVCAGLAPRMGDLLDELLRLSTARIAVEVDPTRLRPHDAPVVLGDAGKLVRELHWHREFPIERTLRDTLEWWRLELSA
jgi:GDP-4-dehydro-6-deoxy-D-mannose reductase